MANLARCIGIGNDDVTHVSGTLALTMLLWQLSRLGHIGADNVAVAAVSGTSSSDMLLRQLSRAHRLQWWQVDLLS